MPTQVVSNQAPVFGQGDPSPVGTGRLSAALSLLAILLLSLSGWAVIGGMAYWALR